MAKRLSDAVTDRSNSKDIGKEIAKQVAVVVKAKARAKAANADGNAARKKIVALGIPARALSYAIALHEMDPEVRATHNDQLQVALDGLGIPMAPVG